MFLFLILVIVGLVILSYGADRFIQASVRIAQYFEISPMIIGMTVVAFGTSAPEAAVSWISSFYGQPGIALGNVVGSNLFNILVVLGITSLSIPLIVNTKIIKFEVPFLIACSLLMFYFLMDYRFDFYEGLIFLVLFIVFNYLQFRLAKKEKKQIVDMDLAVDKKELKQMSLLKEWSWFLVGLVLLIGGSRVFVYGAENVARILGIEEVIIGLTVVAIGTSLPELATSLAAARRGETDMAIGNAVGSNIYNILLVLGGAVFFTDFVPTDQNFLSQDIGVLLFTTIILLPILHSKLRISRWEGLMFLVLYGVYNSLLVSRVTKMESTIVWDSLSFLMAIFSFVVMLNLLYSFYRSFKDSRDS